MNEILELRNSGHVKRWHTVPIIGQQTIAEHVAQCLNLLLTLHPRPSLSLVRATLWHDAPEVVTGDVPAMVKRDHSKLNEALDAVEDEFITCNQFLAMIELTDYEQAWLKAIDTLELVLWASEQMQLGNSRAEEWFQRGIRYLRTNDKTPQQVLDFLTRYLMRQEP